MIWLEMTFCLLSQQAARALTSMSGPPLASQFTEEIRHGLAAVQDAMVAAKKVQASFIDPMTKGDASPVTIADFAVQAMVLSRLAAAYPKDGFIAEETSGSLNAEFREPTADAASMSPYELLRAIDLGTSGLEADGTARRECRRRWILDPIDGTKGFLRGEQFCCALCLTFDGIPVVSVLGCPNLENGTYAVAAAGAGAFVWNQGIWTRLAVSDARLGDRLGLVEGVSRQHSNHDWSQLAFKALTSDPKETLRLDSQAKAVLLCQAKADAFMRLPRRGYVEKVWDAAPAFLLVTEAGGRYTDRLGRPIDFGRGCSLDASVDGIIATNKNLHPHLVQALARTQQFQE